MKLLLFIVALIAIVSFGTIIGVLICLFTGKLTYDDLDKMVKKEKERKAKKCHFSGSSDVMRIAQGKSSWF